MKRTWTSVETSVPTDDSTPFFQRIINGSLNYSGRTTATGKTPFAILREYASGNNWAACELAGQSTGFAEALLELERAKLVYIGRDTSHDKRMGGLKLPDGTACTLITGRIA